MEKIFEILGERLAGFFTRSVAPSSFFFVLLFLNDTFFNEGDLSYEVFCRLAEINQINPVLLYVVLIVVFLAYGYINQLFSQILDNQIKTNYEVCTHDESILEYRKLRTKIKYESTKNTDIFKYIKFNDYNAYQVLGKDLVKSKSYVDEVKTIHTLYIGLSFNILLYFTMFSIFWPFGLILIGLLFMVENMMARGRFIARNKRMYINYLLKKEETKKDKKEIDVKIKSIKVEIDE